MSYTDQDIRTAVANSTSRRQVLIKLGLAPKGGNYKTVKNHIERLNLDTSHFNPYTHGLDHFKPTPVEEYFVKDSQLSSSYVKKKILQEGIMDPICQSCQRTEWMGHPITLELDHINGDRSDNRLENLRLLCPNCHSYTPTWRGRNK